MAVERVLSSIQLLDYNTWAKLIYMEKDKQVTKVYVEENSVIIDGSHASFDGERFGVGGFQNQSREQDTRHHRSYVREVTSVTYYICLL